MGYVIKAEAASHWYKRDGTPCHKVPMKTKPDRERNVNLRDARQLGLYPSVTNIMSCVSAPQLEAWKQSQLLSAALAMPGASGEEIHTEAQRVQTEAMRCGTLYHNSIESIIRYSLGEIGCPDVHEEVPGKFIGEFNEWCRSVDLTFESAELSVACPLGYAGQVDCVGKWQETQTPCIIDWKTQRTKEGKKANYYPKWGAQLAAYAYAVHGRFSYKDVDLVSVVISTTEPNRPIEYKVWGENKKWFDAFMAAFELWKSPLFKNYDPTA